MAVTLSLVDEQNGGGVTCTLTGSGQLDVLAFGPDGWVEVGARPESGVLSVTTGAPGLFWFYAKSATEVSDIIPLYVARADQAMYDKCLEAVKQTVQLAIDGGGLGPLTGTDRQRTLRRDAMKVDHPAAVICPASPSLEPRSNEFDQVIYPCHIFLVDTVSNQADDDETAGTPYHLHAERVRKLFSQQRLAGVSAVDICRVQLGNHLEWQANGYEMVQSIIIVNCVVSRESRGA